MSEGTKARSDVGKVCKVLKDAQQFLDDSIDQGLMKNLSQKKFSPLHVLSNPVRL
jgi:hypothetical protein